MLPFMHITQYPGVYFLSNSCCQTTLKYISQNMHLSMHFLLCRIATCMQLTRLEVRACCARHYCTHHTSRATKGGVRVDTQTSQFQTSGHRHKNLGIILRPFQIDLLFLEPPSQKFCVGRLAQNRKNEYH